MGLWSSDSFIITQVKFQMINNVYLFKLFSLPVPSNIFLFHQYNGYSISTPQHKQESNQEVKIFMQLFLCPLSISIRRSK